MLRHPHNMLDYEQQSFPLPLSSPHLLRQQIDRHSTHIQSRMYSVTSASLINANFFYSESSLTLLNLSNSGLCVCVCVYCLSFICASVSHAAGCQQLKLYIYTHLRRCTFAKWYKVTSAGVGIYIIDESIASCVLQSS